MKPQSITISAFMAYGETEKIDFNQLGDQGLYLITGETGAGKTTIFDAITYALYGEPSGNTRSTDMLRSKYATPDKETYVELVFTCNNKEYKIRRSPKYERLSKRGTGTTTQEATESIECDGKILNSKESPVTKIVEELVGLNKNQFCQIAMLAQGDFQKLLLADTKDKELIFRHIFNTNNYKLLQDAVKNDFIKIKNEKDDQEKSINQYIQGVQVDEEDVLSIDVNKLKNNKLNEDEALLLLEKLVHKDNASLQQLDTKIKENTVKLTDLNNKLTEADRYNKNLLRINENTQQLDTLNQTLTSQKDMLIEVSKNDTKIQSFQQEVGKLQEKEKDFDELDAKQKEFITTTTNAKAQTQSLNQIENALDQLNKQLESDEKELETLKDISDQMIQLNSLLDSTNSQKDNLSTLNTEINRYEKLLVTRESYQKKLVEEEYNKNSLSEELTQKEDLFNREQAGILASTLEEGKPCPVCGSIHHPSLASVSQNAPTQQELKDLKLKVEEATKRYTQATSDATKINTDCNNLKTNIDSSAKQLLNEYNDDSLKTEASAKYQSVLKTLEELNQQNKDLNNKKLRKESLEKSVVKNRQSIKELEPKKLDASKSVTSLNERADSLNKEINNLSAKLGYSSKNELLKAIKEKQYEINRLTKQKEEVQKQVTSTEKEIENITGQIKQLKEDNSKIKNTNIESLTEIKNQLSVQETTLKDQRDVIYSRLDNNKIYQKNITDAYHKMSKVLDEYKWKNTLNNTLNGNISGVDKITLETYIQQSYFDRIVFKANIRFKKMTNQQFELVRSVPTGKNKKSGLDLDVIDHYNGSTRSVKSLSGGEKFKASLSLALGLSDMIQETCKGVRIDCMFVDEGFGSLDDNSLNLAIDVLNELSSGERMIGIISHVAELERKIDKKIIVEKNSKGYSHTRVQLI